MNEHGSTWAEQTQELLEQIDSYFDRTSEAQFLRDLEETGCMPFMEEADE